MDWGSLIAGGFSLLGSKKASYEQRLATDKALAQQKWADQNALAFQKEQAAAADWHANRAFDQAERAAAQTAAATERAAALEMQQFDANMQLQRDVLEMSKPYQVRMMAEEAGFNPLIYAAPTNYSASPVSSSLGNIVATGYAASGDQLTAGGGFMAGHASDILNAGAAGAARMSASGTARAGILQNAGQAQADIWSNNGAQLAQLAMQAQQLDQENRRLTQLTQMQTLQPRTPGIYGPRSGNTAEVPVAGPAAAAAAGQYTNLRMNGWDWPANTDWSDAELAESRYGDIGSNLFGAGVLLGDIQQNIVEPFGQWFVQSGRNDLRRANGVARWVSDALSGAFPSSAALPVGPQFGRSDRSY